MQISLKAARVNAGFTQSEIAEILSVSKATVTAWETGKTSPKSDQFKQLCSIYNCPMDFIFLPDSLL